MSFPAYLSYQDSGVEWLGEVPSHWIVAGLKRAFTIVGGSTPKSEVEAYWDGDIPWITPSDLSGLSGKFIGETARTLTEGGLASCAASLSPAGSVVVSTRAPIGSLAITSVAASTNQGCKTLVPVGGEGATFTFYVLSIATEQLNIRGKGSTFLEISADDLGAFAVPFPPPAEQVAIADFLDRETGKIDALIEEQRRLLTLTKDRIASLVLEAIDGPDSREMRLSQASIVVSRPVQQREGDSYEPLGLFNKGRGLFHKEPRLMIEMGDSDFFWIEPGDLIISGQFAWEGAVALAQESERGCVVSHRYPVLRGRANVALTTYLFALLMTRHGDHLLNEHSRGSAGRNRPLNIRSLLKEKIWIGGKEVQARIDSAVRSYFCLIKEVAAVESLLKERRAALISAAVTGKIDVRGSAKVLPFPIERTRARALVGTEIIERSAGQPTFGRVKFQKMAFLAEGHVGIGELAGCYTRAAAGPLDGALIDDMERGAHSIAGITADQAGGTGTTVSYRLGHQRGAHRQELADWLGPDRTGKLDKLIAHFAPLTTKQAEAVATLYGVWNDLLSEGASPSDDEIITGFLNDWHPEKREKFRAGELPDWLGWMRRHGIVPTGSGPKTTTGRLFV